MTVKSLHPFSHQLPQSAPQYSPFSLPTIMVDHAHNPHLTINAQGILLSPRQEPVPPLLQSTSAPPRLTRNTLDKYIYNDQYHASQLLELLGAVLPQSRRNSQSHLQRRESRPASSFECVSPKAMGVGSDVIGGWKNKGNPLISIVEAQERERQRQIKRTEEAQKMRMLRRSIQRMSS